MADVLDRLGWVTVRMLSYLRLPALASSGLAAALAGLLYFKQKYVFDHLQASHRVEWGLLVWENDAMLICSPSDLIYPRNLPAGARSEIPSPKDFGHDDYEDLRIPTPDGETLGAYLIAPRKDGPKRDLTILMFHGNAGNIGHRVPIALRLEEDLACNVLMLEYRGYGSSTGSPDERGLLIDAQAGLDYIRARKDLKQTKIVVYGQSIGGALAIQLVAGNQGDGRVAGLIVENTFTSMRKLIPRLGFFRCRSG